ncbi:hypothetical protein Tco_0247703 [Tanacetum coccineum]
MIRETREEIQDAPLPHVPNIISYDTKTTLFETVHRQKPSLHIPYVANDSRVELVDMTLQEREKVIGMLKFNLKKAQDRMKSQASHCEARQASQNVFKVIWAISSHYKGLSYVWKHASRAFSLKDSKGKVVTMAEFLRLPNFKGCKVAAGALLPPDSARVLDDKEKKKKKVEAKTAATSYSNISLRMLQHVSSHVPLNHAKPLEALANEEHALANVSAGKEKDQENVDPAFVIEGHGNNEDGLFGLHQRLESVERPVHDTVVPDAEANMMSNLFTPVDNEFFNEEERVEELDKEKAETKEVCMKQADRIKQLEAELKNREMVRRKIINDYLPTFVRRLHQSAEYKRSLGKAFNLAIRIGFIDGISIGRKDPDIQAILVATPNVDPASSNTFMETYESLFDKRYPYVDKVACVYLLDPTGLQNVMPDKTGPTPGQGSYDTPTASYA